ncbi:MAG: acetyl-CoA carboxylase biotin carboxylase subunit [Candidatus Marinimicrobia bacterium]|nr:acetyl-CoA carboxylase biotin carboxylase subunit [Candidatus Neomarinimicrobiota bacterium]
MFQKILIANRGEIAVRIIRTCREMGIQTVAIYSEPDRTSPHVLIADEAYFVGSAPSTESYLNVPKILEIIKKCKAEAVHPGYGFLSENCDFSEAVQKLGVVWIGPSTDAITTMGDKMAARKLVIKAGAPVVPGTTEPIIQMEDARKTAENIGYPILIKAAGGGGGKGMRIIHSENELENAMNQARSEAKKAFADDRIYIEKYLEEPHHIEIQVFADTHGNVVSLGERECSIQRRYQKIIEESPSPFIDDKLRKELSKTAVEISKSCNYLGAGTIEFLVDKFKNFYFLEMNTRLQVEHPITEMVNGLDLVKEQISVAAGVELSFIQKDIYPSGNAIECRIYAEDGFNNFAPSTGIINELTFPLGLGVRMDEGIRIGQEITPYYDPLLGKLITWGNDRQTALERMIRALGEFNIVGIETSIPFCLRIFQHKFFQSGKYSTHTLDLIKNELQRDVNVQNEEQILAARIGAVQSHHQLKPEVSPLKNLQQKTNWATAGRKEELR